MYLEFSKSVELCIWCVRMHLHGHGHGSKQGCTQQRTKNRHKYEKGRLLCWCLHIRISRSICLQAGAWSKVPLKHVFAAIFALWPWRCNMRQLLHTTTAKKNMNNNDNNTHLYKILRLVQFVSALIDQMEFFSWRLFNMSTHPGIINSWFCWPV